MMTSVLTRLTEPGQPLWFFRKDMLRLGQPQKIDRHHAVTVLVACFVAEDFKEEVALKKVTRDSIKHVIREMLKDRFMVTEEGLLEGMSETSTRFAMQIIKEMHADASQEDA